MLKILMGVAKANKYLFPLLVGLAFIALGVETYTYFGALSKYIWVDSRFFLVLALVSAVFLTGDKHNALDSWIFKLNSIVFPVSALIYIVMLFLESSHFPNYIFSTYHIQPANFLYIVLLSLGLFFVSQLTKQKPFFRNVFVSRCIIIFIFVSVYLSGAVGVTQAVVFSDINVFSHINASYDFKMRELWGEYYDYAKFVKEYTPENASILVPPQKFPWASSGNVGVDRYFLFPRNLANGSFDGPLDVKSYDYVMLVWREWGGDESTFGWPKVPIQAEKIIYFDPVTYSTTERLGNYDPKLVSADKAWGLIKIKK
jgi:hypothetical protein